VNSFKTLLGYSPYHLVRPGSRYSALLITGAEEDPEAPSLHARKLAAAFHGAIASDRSQGPVLLRIDRPTDDDALLLAVELRDLVDQQQFLRWQLGVQ
jgi:prolyl oligopeptidase